MTLNHDDAARRLIRYRAACKQYGEHRYRRWFFDNLTARHPYTWDLVLEKVTASGAYDHDRRLLSELFLRHGDVPDAVFDACQPHRIDTTSVAPVIPFDRNTSTRNN